MRTDGRTPMRPRPDLLRPLTGSDEDFIRAFAGIYSS